MTVIHGDCLDLMREMPDASVDSIVTDPPYGLSFMGKEWDHGVPGEPFWREALRVAKPGSYLLAAGGTRTYHRLACGIEDAGWQIQDCLSWLYGSGFPKHKSKLKPAWEPILLAWKRDAKATPLNVDACRLAHGDDLSRYDRGATSAMGYHGVAGPVLTPSHAAGRWPANVCLDEEAAAALDAQSGERPGATSNSRRNQTGSFAPGLHALHEGYGDTGGASRFFYVAKASRREREAGLDGMPLHRAGMVSNTSGQHITRRDGGEPGPAANHHPTVKPLALMRWLCRLVTPPGGVVLDPFMGSGTTGCAAALEGFRFIGCEREAEYVAIAERRIAYWASTVEPALALEVA
jgi:site-specific DNA-methyltransferase (adenine-specific)